MDGSFWELNFSAAAVLSLLSLLRHVLHQLVGGVLEAAVVSLVQSWMLLHDWNLPDL